MTGEERRIEEARKHRAHWKRWVPGMKLKAEGKCV